MINPIDFSQIGDNPNRDNVSSVDSQLFQQSLNSGRSGSLALAAARRSSLEAVQNGAREIIEQETFAVLSKVVNKKNQLILQSRGDSAKKAAEIAKEISF